jgi:hypothetical protein
VVVRSSHQKRRNARPEITNCCHRGCSRCKKADENRRSNSDCERSSCPTADRLAGGSIERVNTANDCIDGNGKPQKDEADAWPTLREAGKESLQRMPPRGTRRASKRLACSAAKWTPRSSAFSRTSRRFFVLSLCSMGELEMYEPASDCYGDGLGAIARTEFLHDVLNVSLYCFL